MIDEPAIGFGSKVGENKAGQGIGQVMFELHEGILLDFIKECLLFLRTGQLIAENPQHFMRPDLRIVLQIQLALFLNLTDIGHNIADFHNLGHEHQLPINALNIVAQVPGIQ